MPEDKATATTKRSGKASSPTIPALLHRFSHNRSILAIAVSFDFLFAGTQAGEILVYDLSTFTHINTILGHQSSILALCLSHDQDILFSSSGDRIVNAWSTSDFRRVYWFYSLYDIGDVFCLAYSSIHETLYLGAQNTSIQWYDLKSRAFQPSREKLSLPSVRQDRFFDSFGPGGVRTPPRTSLASQALHATGGQPLELDEQHVKQYAHFGYVYCMFLIELPGKGDSQISEVLLSGGGDGYIKAWALDSSRNEIQERFVLHDAGQEGDSILSMTADNFLLYAGRLGGDISVWDLETRQLVRNFRAFDHEVMSLSLSGGSLFSASIDGRVKHFNGSYELVSDFQAHKGRILASSFIVVEGRPLLLTGSNDNQIAIWDVASITNGEHQDEHSSNEKMIDTLRRLVGYRTVSSDPRCQGDCRRGASYLRSVLSEFGAVTEMLSTESNLNPTVYARFRANPALKKVAPRILFYGHYDVVAANDEQKSWLFDPFDLQGMNGYLYGRGVSDNKGPIIAAIYAAAELMARGQLQGDIIFLLEGEEECGSRGFFSAVKRNRELIGDVDWILLANSYWMDDDMPCLTYGLRGVIHATVKVHSDRPDLHSGVDGSALLDEPMKDLVTLLARLTGPHGHIELPGFYDDIPSMTKAEKQFYKDITESVIRRNPSLGDPQSLASSLVRRWREASLSVHHIRTSGPDNRTVIPREAEATISIRLVPNQEADHIAKKLIAFLQSEFDGMQSSNTLKVSIDHQAEPWLGDVANSMFKTLEKAIVQVWSGKQTGSSRDMSKPTIKASNGTTLSRATIPTNKSSSVSLSTTIEPSTTAKRTTPRTIQIEKPLYIREGGSIPAIRFLEKEFNAPAANIPCGQASDHAHLDNERLRLINFYNSKDIFSLVFRDLPKVA